MSPLAMVLVSGGVLGVAAPVALGRLRRLARALERAPQPAAWLWLTATVGTLVALLLAGLLLLVPSGGLALDLAALLRTCSMALRRALDAPTAPAGVGPLRPLLGLALLATVPGGLLVGAVVAGARAWRAGRDHHELLLVAGHTLPGLPGVTVLDHAVPLAYCLPGGLWLWGRGRPGPVVVTSAALERLDATELAAVLAHERAHQTRRHHALLLVAEALRRGFPWLPAARTGRAAIARLVELAADDAAVAHHGRADVITALAKLALATPGPISLRPVGLAASGPNAVERIGRLTAPPARWTRWIGALLVAVLLVVPLAAELGAVTAPLLSVAGTPICPIT